MQKVTITLSDEVLRFIDSMAEGNRSKYIDKILKEHYHGILIAETIAALQEDVSAQSYCQEISDWSETVGDGIDA